MLVFLGVWSMTGFTNPLESCRPRFVLIKLTKWLILMTDKTPLSCLCMIVHSTSLFHFLPYPKLINLFIFLGQDKTCPMEIYLYRLSPITCQYINSCPFPSPSPTPNRLKCSRHIKAHGPILVLPS